MTWDVTSQRVGVTHIEEGTSERPFRAIDTVAVAFESSTPRVTWIAKGTAHADEGAANASRVYLFELK